jgi:threonine/homoserine/homoserine lactone efflux protein
MISINELFPDWPLFSAFLAASFVLAVTPGPGVFYIVTRSLVQGRRYGLLSVLGVALGNFGNACIASVGLAALFAVSSVAFLIIKYIGALYLIYLGIKMLRSPAGAGGTSVPDVTYPKRVFLEGVMVALFNPKTALFYAAFLPQFLDPSAPRMLQSIALGAIFVAIAAITDSAYAFAASVPALHVRGLHNAGRRVGGGMLIGLGIFTALVGPRHGK